MFMGNSPFGANTKKQAKAIIGRARKENPDEETIFYLLDLLEQSEFITSSPLQEYKNALTLLSKNLKEEAEEIEEDEDIGDEIQEIENDEDLYEEFEEDFMRASVRTKQDFIY